MITCSVSGWSPQREIQRVLVVAADRDAGVFGRRRLRPEPFGVDRREQDRHALEQFVTTRHQKVVGERAHHHDHVEAPAVILDPESVDDLLLVIVPREPDQIEDTP